MEKRRNEIVKNVNAEMVNPEYVGKNEFNLDTTLPFLGGINVKLNIKSECISSVSAKKELQRQAEENVNLFINGLCKFVDKMNDKIPEISEMVRETKKENSEFWEKERNISLSFERELDNYLDQKVDCADLVIKPEDGEEVIHAKKWAQRMIQKEKYNLLSKKEMEILKKVGIL